MSRASYASPTRVLACLVHLYFVVSVYGFGAYTAVSLIPVHTRVRCCEVRYILSSSIAQLKSKLLDFLLCQQCQLGGDSC